MNVRFDLCVYKDGKYQYIDVPAYGGTNLGTGFSFAESSERSIIVDAYMEVMTQAAQDVSNQIEEAKNK